MGGLVLSGLTCVYGGAWMVKSLGHPPDDPDDMTWVEFALASIAALLIVVAGPLFLLFAVVQAL